MLNVRKVIHRDTYFLALASGDEVEIQFKPCDWMDMRTEQVEDKLVIAYLVQDDSGDCNPLKDRDACGSIWTKPRRFGGSGAITDNMHELCSALHVDGDGFVDRDERITLDGASQSLAEHAADEFLREQGGDELTDDWLIAMAKESEHDNEDRTVGYYDEIHADLVNGDFKDDAIDQIIVRLFMANWREIVGPYVVPIQYHNERGSTSIGVTSWDGDPDDLPDGVWVADENCIENINHEPLPRGVSVKYSYREKCWRVLHEVHLARRAMTGDIQGSNTKFADHVEAFKFAHTLGPGDVAWSAQSYAQAILEEYGDWCDGNVYGCCVEVFKHSLDEGWERIEDDACWGFIGSDNAEQALIDEYFAPAVARLKEVA